MTEQRQPRVVAFAGSRRVASGALGEAAARLREAVAAEPTARVLVFEAETGRPVEVDLRGSEEEVRARVAARFADAAGAAAIGREEGGPRSRGRPRLGVVGREVTLLPRHWEWLGAQRGGASAALRRLVEAARRAGGKGEVQRRSQEAAYRFMVAMAGDEAGFEEAVRALFAGREEGFRAATSTWPADVREEAAALAAGAFAGSGGGGQVAREWRGETAWAVADEYAEHLRRTVVAACRAAPGNRGVLIRRYREGPVAVFLVTTIWESEAALRRVVGEEWERAVHHPDDGRYLLRVPEYVQPAQVLVHELPAQPGRKAAT